MLTDRILPDLFKDSIRFNQLKSLNLSNNGLSDNAFRGLANLAKNTSQLRTLIMNENRIKLPSEEDGSAKES